MKTIVKIIFASTLALSAVAPAFAYEGDATQAPDIGTSTMNSRAQHVTGKHVHMHRGMDANAYEPADVPVGVDFGIESQR